MAPRRRPTPRVLPAKITDAHSAALLSSLTATHLDLLKAAIQRARTTEELRATFRSAMRAYPSVAASAAEKHLDKLFVQGFRKGARGAGAQHLDAGDHQALEWLKTNPIGFLSSLGSFGQSEARWLDQHLRAGTPLNQARAVVARRAADAAYKLERVVQTDRQKASALGRLLAWRDDENRDAYFYGWFPVHDDREKDVSLLFERRNPMTYWQLRKTFEVDHVIPKMVTNRKTGRREAQVSAYNCRCDVARWPKSRGQLVREGLLSQEAS
mgnify:CR=1 FL=1